MEPGVECVADVAALRREIAALKMQRAEDARAAEQRTAEEQRRRADDARAVELRAGEEQRRRADDARRVEQQRRVYYWYFNKISFEVCRNAASLVDSAIISGALPALCASTHLRAHRHHLSPAVNPGNDGGRAADRSFPLLFVNSKNLSSTTAHTVWAPGSSGPVAHSPSRKAPVVFPGAALHGCKRPPKIFLGASPPDSKRSATVRVMVK